MRKALILTPIRMTVKKLVSLAGKPQFGYHWDVSEWARAGPLLEGIETPLCFVYTSRGQNDTNRKRKRGA